MVHHGANHFLKLYGIRKYRHKKLSWFCRYLVPKLITSSQPVKATMAWVTVRRRTSKWLQKRGKFFSFQFYLHKLHNTISQIADLLSRRVRSLNFYYPFTINLHRGFFKRTAEKLSKLSLKGPQLDEHPSTEPGNVRPRFYGMSFAILGQ